MTSSYKYNEPRVVSRDQGLTSVSDDDASIRLLSHLISQIVGIGTFDGDSSEENVLPAENSSFPSSWDPYYFVDETSLGPCSTSNGSCNNLTSESDFYGSYSTWQLVVLGLLAGCTSLVTVIGNMIVILSFIVDRTIRQPTNYFIASLAVSDLLIGSISMPFYTVYLLAGESWPLGEFLCDLWLSIDYTVCLCSIYTVFCITIDRFCSVTIPAKYRNWRTEQKVLVMVAVTWVVPSIVFFLSIFGWQYFVGERTVPSGKCYVQYMETALFNCLLQVGYFWVTLVVMCTLYTGIYRVALTLQRKSEAKHKKMTSLVSMAGQTMTRIGLGVSTGPPGGTNNTDLTTERTRLTAAVPNKTGGNCAALTDVAIIQPGVKAAVPDRSSSPAFASDTDPGSGSATCSRHNGSTKTTPSGGIPRAAPADDKMNDAGIYMGPEGDDETDAAAAAAANGCLVLASSVVAVASIELLKTDDDANEDHKNQTTSSLLDTASSTSQLKLISNSTSATSKDDVKSNKSDIDVKADCSPDTGSLLTPQKKGTVLPALSPSNKQLQHHLSLTSIDSMSKGFRSRSRSRNQRDGSGSNSGSHRSSSGRKLKSGSLRIGRHGLAKKISGRRKDGAQPGGQLSGRGGAAVAASSAQSKSENRARKALRTITVILGAFVLCWTPWHVLSMIMGFCSDCVHPALYNVSYWLCYMNSPVNPFCYALANQQFKKTFARILRFDWRRT